MNIQKLEEIIKERINNKTESSYTYSIVKEGIDKLTKKVGEEAVEVVIAAKNEDLHSFNNEVADLLYHIIVLVQYKGSQISNIEEILEERHLK